MENATREVVRILKRDLGFNAGERYARRIAAMRGEHATIYHEAAETLAAEKVLLFDGTGMVTTLYADDLPDLGRARIERASHVEPSPDGNGWDVVLTDAEALGEHKGKVLARNVPKRSDALALEVEFINREVLQ